MLTVQVKKTENLCEEEYFVRYLGICRQNWQKEKEFDCFKKPKGQHLLLLLDGCSASYVFKSGMRIEAKSGEIVYTPKGSEYKVTFRDFEEKGSTVGINFLLFDANGEEFSLADETEVYPFNETFSLFFKEAERLSLSPKRIPAKFNTVLYNLLTEAGEKKQAKLAKSNFRLIENALVFLQEHYRENTDIAELAKLCNVSEVYLRKLFKLHTGKSPTKYRTHLRLLTAKDYLRYGELSVNELAAYLGYRDTAYFIKQFKEEFSVSPLVYRMKTKK